MREGPGEATGLARFRSRREDLGVSGPPRPGWAGLMRCEGRPTRQSARWHKRESFPKKTDLSTHAEAQRIEPTRALYRLHHVVYLSRLQRIFRRNVFLANDAAQPFSMARCEHQSGTRSEDLIIRF